MAEPLGGDLMINRPDIQISPENIFTAQAAERIFNAAPPAYKKLITHEDWLMVLGGLKGATECSFPGDTWNPQEFEKLKIALEQEGLRLIEPTLKDRPGTPFRQGIVYNPQTIRQATADSKYSPPYDGKEPLQIYVEKAISQGYSIDAVWGKLYSFPESAIQDFINSINEINLTNSRLTSSGLRNEAYLHSEPAQEDVLQRENKKERFFSEITTYSPLAQIMMSSDLQDSKREWTRRLPTKLQIRKTI